jgi:imidazolonepropionase-like amidohydrolase
MRVDRMAAGGERSGDRGLRYVVSAGRAFDGSRFLAGGAQVLVDDGRIVAGEPRRRPYPGGWPVIYRPSGTVLPGLIDTHVHRAAAQNSSTDSFKLLRQARERLGEGLRGVGAGDIGDSDEISLRGH